jgi:hypothetical protein
MSNQKSMRTVPVVAVEIRSPCATNFNHPQYVTRSVPVGAITSPDHLENSSSKPTGRRAWYLPAGNFVPFQPSNLGIALCCAGAVLCYDCARAASSCATGTRKTKQQHDEVPSVRGRRMGLRGPPGPAMARTACVRLRRSRCTMSSLQRRYCRRAAAPSEGL